MKKMEFKGDGGTFSALRAAEDWAKKNGYYVGPLCSPLPVGLSKHGMVPKWKHLSQADQEALDGRIDSVDFRNGSVTIILND